MSSISIKSTEEIEKMRIAGKLASEVLEVSVGRQGFSARGQAGFGPGHDCHDCRCRHDRQRGGLPLVCLAKRPWVNPGPCGDSCSARVALTCLLPSTLSANISDNHGRFSS